MPYLDEFAKARMDSGLAPETAGELTYCLTRQLQRYLHFRPPTSYEQLAVALGALEGCKADFKERIFKPYEEKKREINGDVW